MSVKVEVSLRIHSLISMVQNVQNRCLNGLSCQLAVSVFSRKKSDAFIHSCHLINRSLEFHFLTNGKSLYAGYSNHRTRTNAFVRLSASETLRMLIVNPDNIFLEFPNTRSFPRQFAELRLYCCQTFKIQLEQLSHAE